MLSVVEVLINILPFILIVFGALFFMNKLLVGARYSFISVLLMLLGSAVMAYGLRESSLMAITIATCFFGAGGIAIAFAGYEFHQNPIPLTYHAILFILYALGVSYLCLGLHETGYYLGMLFSTLVVCVNAPIVKFYARRFKSLSRVDRVLFVSIAVLTLLSISRIIYMTITGYVDDEIYKMSRTYYYMSSMILMCVVYSCAAIKILGFELKGNPENI